MFWVGLLCGARRVTRGAGKRSIGNRSCEVAKQLTGSTATPELRLGSETVTCGLGALGFGPDLWKTGRFTEHGRT